MFSYVLFNDVGSSSDYIASNGRAIMNNELDRMKYAEVALTGESEENPVKLRIAGFQDEIGTWYLPNTNHLCYPSNYGSSRRGIEDIRFSVCFPDLKYLSSFKFVEEKIVIRYEGKAIPVTGREGP
jgi:hypothetical protein